MELLLTRYDPCQDIVVSDASDYGIGAVVSHLSGWKEKRNCKYTQNTYNYNQIEKEAMTIVFAIKMMPLYSDRDNQHL